MKPLATLLALSIAVWPSSVELRWTDRNPPGATKTFYVYRAPRSCASVFSESEFSRIGTAPTPRFVDGAVSRGAYYCYAVAAVTSVESPRSARLTVQIPKKRWFFF